MKILLTAFTIFAAMTSFAATNSQIADTVFGDQRFISEIEESKFEDIETTEDQRKVFTSKGSHESESRNNAILMAQHNATGNAQGNCSDRKQHKVSEWTIKLTRERVSEGSIGGYCPDMRCYYRTTYYTYSAEALFECKSSKLPVGLGNFF